MRYDIKNHEPNKMVYYVFVIVGWQATQKCDIKYIVKKMDFFFGIFLFDTQMFKKVMLY